MAELAPRAVDHRGPPTAPLFRVVHTDAPIPVPHCHQPAEWEVCYFLGGQGQYHIADRHYPIHRGDVFVVNHEELHCIEADSPDRVTMLIQPQLLATPLFPEPMHFEQLFVNRPQRASHCVNLSEPELDELDFIVARLVDANRSNAPERSTICLGYLCAVIGIVHRAYLRKGAPMILHGATVDLVYAMANYIDAHVQQRLTLRGLADQAGVTPSYFSSMFRKVMDMPLMTYICRRRLEIAKRLLRTTELKVSAVCLESGFNDLSHFNRVFKANIGRSPLRYRRMHRVRPVPATQIT